MKTFIESTLRAALLVSTFALMWVIYQDAKQDAASERWQQYLQAKIEEIQESKEKVYDK